jgi:hypothetical protein
MEAMVDWKIEIEKTPMLKYGSCKEFMYNSYAEDLISIQIVLECIIIKKDNDMTE